MCSCYIMPENRDSDRLLGMLKPADPGAWTLHPVSRRVNSPRNDGPELLESMDTSQS